MRNLSYENEFCMQFHFHGNQRHFDMKGFTHSRDLGNGLLTLHVCYHLL